MTANLAEALSDYLTLRRSMGFSLTRVGQLLSGYVAWLDQQGIPAVTVDATHIDAHAFRRLYGEPPLPLSTTASKRKLQI